MKFLASLITTVVAATMLSLGVSAPAHAKCDGYGACIDTRLSAWSMRTPIRARQRAPFAVRFRAENGKAPRGTVTIRVVRRSNGNVVWSGTRWYNERREEYRTGRLPRGRFTVKLHMHTRSDRFEDARARFGQRVTRR